MQLGNLATHATDISPRCIAEAPMLSQNVRLLLVIFGTTCCFLEAPEHWNDELRDHEEQQQQRQAEFPVVSKAVAAGAH